MSDEATTNANAELVERVLSDPQLLEVVTSLARDMPKDMGEAAAAENTQDAHTDDAKIQAEDDRTQADGHAYNTERRHTLLLAIRPYLSENRAKMLDSMEAFANLLELFRKS